MLSGYKRHMSGFTLLELGIVLIVLSLLAAGALSIVTQNIRIKKAEELQEKLNAIEKAVLAYRKEHGDIPCPGQMDLLNTDTGFGFQGTGGDCGTGSTPSDPVASFDDGVNTVGGSVPVRNLGLNDSYMYDPWGHKFFYIADVRATNPGTFSVNLNDPTALGSITVLDDDDEVGTAYGALLVFSVGPNGHGGITAAGQRDFNNSTNAHEWENCGCNASAVTTFNATFYLHPATTTPGDALDSFDDVGRYYIRQQLLSPGLDLVTETP